MTKGRIEKKWLVFSLFEKEKTFRLTYKEEKLPTKILQFVIFLGVFLSFYQFIFNRNLWLDEAMLALNIISKSFTELLQPLASNQVAPIGFLFIEKFFAITFSNSDYSFRIFPLLSFYLSIPFFYLLSKQFTKNTFFAYAATALFSINLMLLYYSTEVKQYSTDVLVSIVILYTTLNLNSRSSKSLALYVIVGMISIWFSNTAVIILFVCGLYSIYNEYIKKRNWIIILPIICWLISFVIYYLLFVLNHPTLEMMTNYWERFFLPLNPFSKEFYYFLYGTVKDATSISIPNRSLWLFPLTVSFIGIVYLIKEKKFVTLYFLFFPILVHLLISGLELYPFRGRFILYLYPLMILIYIGLYYTWELIRNKFFKLSIYFLLIPIIINLYPLLKVFPIEKEEINESLTFLTNNIEEEDRIYVFRFSVPTFTYYQRKKLSLVNNEVIFNKHWENWESYYSEIIRLKDTLWWSSSNANKYRNEVIYGKYWENSESYYREIIKLKGNLWLLSSNANWHAEKYVINSLKEIGYSIQLEKHYPGSSIYKVTDNNLR